jgi:hypothetical protein
MLLDEASLDALVEVGGDSVLRFLPLLLEVPPPGANASWRGRCV